MVSTGGTEMGQGVNTRVRQIVADELGVEYDAVIVGATSTDKNNNTSPTAASRAAPISTVPRRSMLSRSCTQRLRRVRGEHVFAKPQAAFAVRRNQRSAIRARDASSGDARATRSIASTFRKSCCRAYIERINLGERGFYATPGVDFNRETGKGTSVPVLHQRRRVQRGADRPLHRRDEASRASIC